MTKSPSLILLAFFFPTLLWAEQPSPPVNLRAELTLNTVLVVAPPPSCTITGPSIAYITQPFTVTMKIFGIVTSVQFNGASEDPTMAQVFTLTPTYNTVQVVTFNGSVTGPGGTVNCPPYTVSVVVPPTYEYYICTLSSILSGGGAIGSQAEPCAPPSGSSLINSVILINSSAGNFAYAYWYEKVHQNDGYGSKKYYYAQVGADASYCPNAAVPSGFTFKSGGCTIIESGACVSSLCLFEAPDNTIFANRYQVTEAGDAPGCPNHINCAPYPPSGYPNLVHEMPYYTCGNGYYAADFCLWKN